MHKSIYTAQEIKYLWKCRGTKGYELKRINTSGNIIQNIIFNDVQNYREVAGKLIASPKEGEAYHWPRLKHENLAPLLDIVFISETVGVYITNVFKKSLRDIIHDEEFVLAPNCFTRKKLYAEDVLWGLEYLQSKHLCLLNLNEANIYIDGEDKAVISNFSCLRLSEKASASNINLPNIYRSPELINPSTENFDAVASEMWAYGVMILQVFTGHAIPMAAGSNVPHLVLHFAFNMHQSVLAQANMGTLITPNIFNQFRCFLKLFLNLDPTGRVTANLAATSTFFGKSRRRLFGKLWKSHSPVNYLQTTGKEENDFKPGVSKPESIPASQKFLDISQKKDAVKNREKLKECFPSNKFISLNHVSDDKTLYKLPNSLRCKTAQPILNKFQVEEHRNANHASKRSTFNGYNVTSRNTNMKFLKTMYSISDTNIISIQDSKAETSNDPISIIEQRVKGCSIERDMLNDEKYENKTEVVPNCLCIGNTMGNTSNNDFNEVLPKPKSVRVDEQNEHSENKQLPSKFVSYVDKYLNETLNENEISVYNFTPEKRSQNKTETVCSEKSIMLNTSESVNYNCDSSLVQPELSNYSFASKKELDELSQTKIKTNSGTDNFVNKDNSLNDENDRQSQANDIETELVQNSFKKFGHSKSDSNINSLNSFPNNASEGIRLCSDHDTFVRKRMHESGYSYFLNDDILTKNKKSISLFRLALTAGSDQKEQPKRMYTKWNISSFLRNDSIQKGTASKRRLNEDRSISTLTGVCSHAKDMEALNYSFNDMLLKKKFGENLPKSSKEDLLRVLIASKSKTSMCSLGFSMTPNETEASKETNNQLECRSVSYLELKNKPKNNIGLRRSKSYSCAIDHKPILLNDSNSFPFFKSETISKINENTINQSKILTSEHNQKLGNDDRDQYILNIPDSCDETRFRMLETSSVEIPLDEITSEKIKTTKRKSKTAGHRRKFWYRHLCPGCKVYGDDMKEHFGRNNNR